MLIAFLTKSGAVELYDSDETPAMYWLNTEEATIVAEEHARREHGKLPAHMSASPFTRRDVRGVGMAAAQQKLFKALRSHPKAQAYLEDRKIVGQAVRADAEKLDKSP